ncbi:hypothetical protein B0H13DRAFT_2308346 [Mycena leptocephala]|nr:hypothetical protein B0H13DRAFT_2308346 [Mycena leptocephala]
MSTCARVLFEPRCCKTRPQTPKQDPQRWPQQQPQQQQPPPQKQSWPNNHPTTSPIANPNPQPPPQSNLQGNPNTLYMPHAPRPRSTRPAPCPPDPPWPVLRAFTPMDALRQPGLPTTARSPGTRPRA